MPKPGHALRLIGIDPVHRGKCIDALDRGLDQPPQLREKGDPVPFGSRLVFEVDVGHDQARGHGGQIVEGR